MRRFIVEKEQIRGRTTTLVGPEARHMVHVLRLGVGDTVELVDNRGNTYTADIEAIDGGRITLSVGEAQGVPRESPIRITFAQALLKDRKMDTLIRQLTELGVTRWMPFPAERSVPRPDAERFKKRVARWGKIALGALKQCRRNHPPSIEPQASYTAVLDAAVTSNVKVIFSETAREPLAGRGAASERIESVFFLVGPEGGFTPREIAAARSLGFDPVSLGPRILRAETASVAACALIQHIYGDLGRK